MKIEDDDLIKAWISRDVEPLTDAEPGALAKYVIALIKKPLSDDELEKLCLEKLEVFLQSHTKSFVERLFRCLKGGLYLPEASQPTNDSPSNEFDDGDDFVLTDGGGSGVEDDEETQSKPTSNPEKKRNPLLPATTARPQRRRISPPASSSSSKPVTIKEEGDKEVSGTSAPSRSHPTNRRPSPPARGGRGRMGAGSRDARPSGRSERYHRRQRSWSRSRSRSRSPHRKEKREEHEPSRRHRCRDFHEKGFCMRGDKCINPAGAVPSSTTNAASAAVGAAVYNPMNPPPPGIDNKVVYGASPTTEPYNPEAPGLNAHQQQLARWTSLFHRHPSTTPQCTMLALPHPSSLLLTPLNLSMLLHLLD
uniref:C3H1-type domain-containing protein n=1 Tax=Ditylenchus dipsaci TaxID=166011 RepID=A0A915EFT3_9BILA